MSVIIIDWSRLDYAIRTDNGLYICKENKI